MDDNLNIRDAIDYGQRKGAGCLGDLVLATLRRLEHSGGPGAGDLVDRGQGTGDRGQGCGAGSASEDPAPLPSGKPAKGEMRKAPLLSLKPAQLEMC